MKNLPLAVIAAIFLITCNAKAGQFSYICSVASLKDSEGRVTEVNENEVIAVWTENQFAQCNILTGVCTFATFSDVTEKGNNLYISMDKITVTSSLLALELGGVWSVHTHKNHVKQTILVQGQCHSSLRNETQGVLKKLEQFSN